jgi:hypothetical protein
MPRDWAPKPPGGLAHGSHNANPRGLGTRAAPVQDTSPDL